MKDNRRAVIVGLFLAIGLVIFIVGVFTLGSSSKTFSKRIHVTAVFDDVEGLKVGNNVWFSGVIVGNISDIHFIGTSQVQVKLSIITSAQAYIHRNASVRISSDGLIGNKIIVIDGGSPQAPIVDDGNQLQAAKLPSTDDIMKTLQQNNENLLAITGDFKLLSHKILQGKGTVGSLMADSTMAIQLRNSMRNLQTATQSAAVLAQQMEIFSRKVNTKGGLADKMFTDTVVFSRVKAAATQFQQAATNANNVTVNLAKTSDKLNHSDNALGYLLNDPKGAEQVRSTMNNLQQSSQRLNEDLQALQSNFFFRTFFKKKAKAEADSIKKAQGK
jgi:phospholipid/cholesterol/gamma-HCH transport system substrate-binding protein